MTCCCARQLKVGGGHVFKTVGDAFYAAFEAPDHALGAALAVQQFLHTGEWSFPDGQRLRVRLALHTGPAEAREGDYFGPALNGLPAARLGRTDAHSLRHHLLLRGVGSAHRQFERLPRGRPRERAQPNFDYHSLPPRHRRVGQTDGLRRRPQPQRSPAGFGGVSCHPLISVCSRRRQKYGVKFSMASSGR